MENILLLHGMGGPNPLNYIENGLKSEFHILKPTMPGFRADDGFIQYSDELYVNFIENYRKEESVESFIVIGYSMGGRTALNYSFKYPERVKKLILIDTVGLSYMIPILRFNFGKAFLKKVLPRMLKYSFVQEMLGKPDFVNTKSEEYKLGKEWMREMMENSVIRSNFVEILTSIGSPIPSLAEKLRELQMPVQLLWADKDKTAKVSTAYWTEKHLQNYELKILKGFRHMAPIECPEFYIDNILEFSRESVHTK